MIRKSVLILFSAVLITGCAKNEIVHEIETQPTSGIIQGEVVTQEQIPGVHRLEIQRVDVCSSVQISETQLLTAVHCSRYKGYLKEIIRTLTHFGEVFSVSIGSQNPAQDIALIAVDPKTAMKAEDSFLLPTSGQLPEDLFIAGYGRHEFETTQDGQLRVGKVSKSLQILSEINTVTVPSFTIQDVAKQTTLNKQIKEGKMICFKPVQDHPQISSFGDSGGPLFSYTQDGKRVVHGIAVFVITNGNNKTVLVSCYEPLFPYLPEIKNLTTKYKHLLNNHTLEIKTSQSTESIENTVAESVHVLASRTVQKQLVDGRLGLEKDLKQLNLQDKFVLVQRGEISFIDKIKNAKSRGAQGIIIFDDVEGDVLNPRLQDGSLGIEHINGFDIRFITQKDGDKIIQMLNKSERVDAVLSIAP